MFNRTISTVVINLFIAAFAMAGFTIDFQSATVDQTAGTVSFQIGFNQIPDFYTLSQSGYQAHSFQYFIDCDKSPVYPGDLEIESIIRGEEIHLYDQIVVRDTFPFGMPDPGSGGYGPIRGMVDFTLEDKVLSFTTSLDLLGDMDGSFSYGLMLCEYGYMTDWIYSEGNPTPPVPTPTALILGAIGVFLVKSVRKNS